MSTTLVLALATIPGVLGLQLPGGVGKLPALGWNSWVWLADGNIISIAY